MRVRLAVLGMLLVFAPSAARAATITVNTTSQTVGVDGLCSLPEAIASAGGSSTGNDCAPGDNPGMDDIVLPAGTLNVSYLGLTDVRLLGQGAGTTVLDAGGTSTVLTTNGTVELHDLTATHGQAPSHGLGQPGDAGGGIHEVSGSLTVVGCAVSDNVAGHGGQGADQSTSGGAGGDGGNGGGIYVSAGATLSLVTSTVSGNRAGAGGAGGAGSSGGSGVGGFGGRGGWGGGIYVDGNAHVTIDRSTISGNVAGDGGPGGTGTGDSSGTGGTGGFGGAGGGIGSEDGKVTITASSIWANRAGAGGDGGEGDGTPLTTGAGYGGSGGTPGPGGGLMFGGSITELSALTNTTITGNVAGAGGNGGKGHGATDGVTHGASVAGHGEIGGYGGGITILSVPVGLLHDTVVGNQVGAPGLDYGATTGGGPGQGPGLAYSAGAIQSTLAKSIVSGCHGSPTDLGFNLGTGGCPGNGADPQLGPLQDNGGPVQTMRPAAGSPAVDAVPPDQGCASADARGVPRPVGAGCDIGAVELAPPFVTTGDPTGATLTGTVDGHGLPTRVAFEYGDTTAYGATLTAVPLTAAGPTAESVTPGPLLPGTYHYRVTASNADGASAGADKTLTISGQSPRGGSAPVITKLSFKPRRLKRGHSATVRFRISEAAGVKLSFARRMGRRYRAAGSLTRKVRAGAVKLTFKRRTLKPGRYRVTLVATDAARRRSKPVSATFTVVAA